MSDSKHTKRFRQPNECTLEEMINKKRKELIDDKNNIPLLEKEIAVLDQRASTKNERWQYRQKCFIEQQKKKIQDEIDIRKSLTREFEFETLVVTYLKTYHNSSMENSKDVNVSKKNDTMQAFVKHTDHSHLRKSIIRDEYLAELNQTAPKVAMATRDECPKCNEKLLICSKRSILTCPDCGYAITYLDATSSSTSFDDVVEFGQYSYKRINHYLTWMALVQGKESHRVPDDILNQVMYDLYHRCNIRKAQQITQKRVRESLRHLKLRKAYDNVAQITTRLSGKKTPRISSDTEELLKNMFLQMQPYFNRHAPKSRTNFLSYSYVLYRSFQILGLNHMLESITLLKGKDKLAANDAIFRRMADDMGWTIPDLPDIN